MFRRAALFAIVATILGSSFLVSAEKSESLKLSQAGRFLLPPQPTDEKPIEKPYFNPKNYTVADFYRLVEGAKHEIQKSMDDFEKKVDGFDLQTKKVNLKVQAVEVQLLEKIAALEAKVQHCSQTLSPLLPGMDTQIGILLVQLGMILIPFMAIITGLVFCYFRRGNPAKYASVEKLMNNM
ncbi:hypothetical protein Ddc_10263 [Ditylenchus destructor]|nr:hypothetical protein Ddc_10263 [Ditylenchus destructor]